MILWQMTLTAAAGCLLNPAQVEKKSHWDIIIIFFTFIRAIWPQLTLPVQFMTHKQKHIVSVMGDIMDDHCSLPTTLSHYISPLCFPSYSICVHITCLSP